MSNRDFWNRWVAALLASVVVSGGLAYVTSPGGILSEYSLGGSVGQSIKGPSDALGVLRLTGMTVVVLVVAFPVGSRVFSRLAFAKTRRFAEITGPIRGRGLPQDSGRICVDWP